MNTRQPYPSDVSDEEWTFVAPYLALLAPDAGQRKHELRDVFNALRWLVRTGAHWRMLPHDLPPWAAVYQQTRRWMAAGCFESIVHDLRLLLRVAAGRDAQPTAVILDGRTVQSTPESGSRAGYDGHKRCKGSVTLRAILHHEITANMHHGMTAKLHRLAACLKGPSAHAGETVSW
jgi:transposase